MDISGEDILKMVQLLCDFVLASSACVDWLSGRPCCSKHFVVLGIIYFAMTFIQLLDYSLDRQLGVVGAVKVAGVLMTVAWVIVAIANIYYPYNMIVNVLALVGMLCCRKVKTGGDGGDDQQQQPAAASISG